MCGPRFPSEFRFDGTHGCCRVDKDGNGRLDFYELVEYVKLVALSVGQFSIGQKEAVEFTKRMLHATWPESLPQSQIHNEEIFTQVCHCACAPFACNHYDQVKDLYKTIQIFPFLNPLNPLALTAGCRTHTMRVLGGRR
eukprot:1195243-Prorocentrum_minimum.AAC.3